MPYEWNHVVDRLLCFLSFSFHNAEGHPWFMYQYFMHTFLLHHILSICHLKDIWVFSDFSYEYLCIFSIILDKYLRVGLLGHIVSMYFMLLQTALCFLNDGTILHPHHNVRGSSSCFMASWTLFIFKSLTILIGVWQFDFDMFWSNSLYILLGVHWATWVHSLWDYSSLPN